MSDSDKDMVARMDLYMSAFVSGDEVACLSKDGGFWLEEYANLACECIAKVDKHIQISKEFRSEDCIEKMHQRKRELKGLPE
jgi:hypothetical protein